jgi:Beta-lactamase
LSQDAVVRSAFRLRRDLAQVPLAALDAKHLASIDDFVNHEMSRQRIPGLELGIYSRGRILLKQSSLDQMWTVYPLNDGKPNPGGYGFGWMIGAQNGHKRIEHGGAWQGFTCRISRYPDDNLTVVELTNLDAGYSNPGEIAHVAAGLVVPALTIPKLEAIVDDQPELAVRLKKLLDEIVAGTDIRSETTPQLAAAITPDTSKRWQQRLAKLWPGGALTLVKPDKGSKGEPQWVSTYRLSKGGDAMLLVFGLDADRKIPIFDLLRNREYERR